MEPYRLAICEDDPTEGRYLRAMCARLLRERQIPYTLRLFSSAEKLAQALEKNSEAFDLLLLDIQMEGKSGMALAKELYQRQIPVRILFITGYVEYALEGYKVHPIHYLLKPVKPDALEQVLVQDWKEHHRAKNLLLRSGSKSLSLPVADILYMESRNHTLTISTTKRKYSFPGSLSEVENLVPPGIFYRCHNSFLVSIGQVEEISRTALILRNGTKIPIGRRYYQSFQTAFIHFINQNSRP